MKTFQNGTGIAASFLLLLVGLCCCSGSSVDSLYPACVTPDKTKIAIGHWGGRTLILDARTGEVIKTAEATEGEGENKHSGAVVCSADNEIVAVFPKKARWLTRDRETPREGSTGKLLGMTADDRLIGFSGGFYKDGDGDLSGRPLEIFLTGVGDRIKDNKPLEVKIGSFPGINSSSSYLIFPVRVLTDGNILVATTKMPSYQYGNRIETKVGPAPWNFYGVDPETGEVKPHGEIKQNDVEINFVDPPVLSSTPDGRLSAIGCHFEGVFVAVYDGDSGKEVFRRKVEGGEVYVRGMIFSDDGSRLAIMYLSYAAGSTDHKVKVFDAKTGQELKTFSLGSSTPYFAGFIGKGLIVKRTLKSDAGRDENVITNYDVETGEPIWETKPSEIK
ncbi:MAG: hypothetical protein R2747_08515 [Pyrinomonadaceae bacterium]